MTTAPSGVALTVVAGTTGVPTRTFAKGALTETVSVGSRGEWEISAPGVEATHLYVAFDGSRLHVAAASQSTGVLLRGVPVGMGWRSVLVPSEIHFGSACIIVLPADMPESLTPRGEAAAEIAEDECLTVFRSSPSNGSADVEPPTLLFNVPAGVGDPRVLALTVAEERVSDSSQHPSLLDSDAPTCCDGGALRDQAAQLARAISCAAVPSSSPVAKSAASNAVAVQGSSTLPEFVDRIVLSWRAASRPQRAICVLLPFVLCAASWSPNSDAHSDTTSESSTIPQQRALENDGTSAVKSTRSYSIGGVSSATAAPATRGPNAPTANTASLTAIAPTESLPPRPAARIPEGSADLNSDIEPPRSATGASTAQRDAFNAARVGRLAEAAEMYQQLASTSNSGAFSKAERLTRDKAVRTP